MLDVYRGNTNVWECDEMGHMNVRFYVAKANEGLAVFARYLGLDPVFMTSSDNTLLPFDQHIRFMREVHPGAPIYIRAGIIEILHDSMLIYMEMIHTKSEDISASFRTWVRYCDSRTTLPGTWPEQTIEKAKTMMVEPPAEYGPRSIDMSIKPGKATLQQAVKLGAVLSGQGQIPLEHCDVFGRMRSELVVGRISDSVPNLLAKWREQIGKGAGKSGKVGAAVLEYRLVYRKWPKAGDLFEIRSGLGYMHDKVHSLIHWMMDPVSGEAYATTEAVAITLDLVERKAIPTPKAQQQSMRALLPEGIYI